MKNNLSEEMFETVYDLDGNPLSEEEMRERDIEDYDLGSRKPTSLDVG